MSKNVEEIAEGLTEAQRADLVSEGCSLSASEAGEYSQLGLMNISFESGSCGARLTPLGLAVRDHLKGLPHD